jgi:hypothetical protein
MQTALINPSEKKILIERFKTKLSLSLFTLLITSILYYTSLALFSYPIICITIFILCLLFNYWINLHTAIKELISKEKLIKTELITELKTDKTYGYTGSPLVDLMQQPVLVECIIKTKESEFLVSEDFYKTFKIGDEIKVSYSLVTKTIIGFERMIN